MPSDRKKKKGGAKRAAVLARRAEKPRPTAHPAVQFELMPPLPGPEKCEDTLRRLLGYKHLTRNGRVVNLVVSQTRRENGQIRVVEMISKGVPSHEYCEFSPEKLHDVRGEFSPDYDRDAADYPVASQVMKDHPPQGDIARHARKRIGDVPREKLEVFLSFLERGKNIRVDYRKSPPSSVFAVEFNVTLKGAMYTGNNCQSFNICIDSSGGHRYQFSGCLHTVCFERYQKELAMLLTYEILHQLSSGMISFDSHQEESDFANFVVLAGTSLRAMCAQKKRWTDIVHLSKLLLEWMVERRYSMFSATGAENQLGEALESCGLYSQAALVYTEAANHLLNARHPGTFRGMLNAGLAWTRHGANEKAETCLAMALHSLRFEKDHIEYRPALFETLGALHLFYLSTCRDVRLRATLLALIFATGEASHMPCLPLASSPLLSEYRNATPEQMCRVMQSIVTKSSSAKFMREAILECSDPKANFATFLPDSIVGLEVVGAREVIRETCASSGLLTSCSSCGNVKKDKSLMMCPCKMAYYCDVNCQKKHWLQHKAHCMAGRKAANKNPQYCTKAV